MQKDESYRRYLMESPRAQSKGSTYERDISFYAHELPDQRIPPARGLSCPVILPQRRPEDQSRGIIRAYSPELACCGIDQMTFLEFIDDFNEAHKSSPYLDAVNVAAQGVGFAPGISPMVVSMVVPIAVRAAKGYQTQRQSTSFLDRANTDLFIPHGLFAMVLTFKPNQTQSPYGAPKQIQLPPSAPLIYPEDERRAQQTGLKKMGHFISDYGDRRAQARYASNNPDSSLASPLPKFGNRWADPNHPANGGGLKSLLTGVPDDGKSRKQERKDRKQDRKDRHRRRSSSSDSSKRSGLLSTALSAAGEASGRNGLSRNERPSLVGTAREMINGPEKQNQSLIKGVKSLGMNTNILYLMITNNCNTNDENPSIPSTRSQIPFTYTSTIPPHHTQPTHSTTLLNSSEPSQKPIYPTAHQNRTFTYTAAQQQNNNPYINKQTQIQTQTQVASIASSNYTTRAFEAHDVPPPPAYREVMPMRYYERMRGDDEEFCVPTL
ncbi:b9ebadb1-6125-4a64-b8c0-a1a5ee814530 [Sclerotinia trifoliorum]|uniref:B9ebadb1-6125-4a64-b8c0-a1a5ee814530 n=1 Tax=Sclerotinia trifoliorum TaxID=28548 RepID=A0A8H2VWG2_9HELO|nr:b9ebadb1-6125-4a64-b8c0-a1a5ee814530 [Sclerotinia trifoliorum]